MSESCAIIQRQMADLICDGGPLLPHQVRHLEICEECRRAAEDCRRS